MPYQEFPPSAVRRFCLTTFQTGSGSNIITVTGKSQRGDWEIERMVADGRSFTASEIEGVFATLRDAIMRELVVTQGVQVSIGDLSL